MSDFSAGANIDDKHYFGINWERDLKLPEVADIRNVVEGDPSPSLSRQGHRLLQERQALHARSDPNRTGLSVD